MKRKRTEPVNPLKRKCEEDVFLSVSKQRTEGQFNYGVHEYKLMILKLVAQNRRLLARAQRAEERCMALTCGTPNVPVDCI